GSGVGPQAANTTGAIIIRITRIANFLLNIVSSLNRFFYLRSRNLMPGAGYLFIESGPPNHLLSGLPL
ncbi:MAG: hypothetical protein PVF47_00005, partial [Anaerolineae bacterium]